MNGDISKTMNSINSSDGRRASPRDVVCCLLTEGLLNTGLSKRCRSCSTSRDIGWYPPEMSFYVPQKILEQAVSKMSFCILLAKAQAVSPDVVLYFSRGWPERYLQMSLFWEILNRIVSKMSFLCFH
ncbi:hypothetical protein AVEN_252028-1 [Araneus ventricosus]|uniref:Uncharacterized protein n=1 Tax=Araneus ventricosus TaxID=182803 RepID=A0A4Y2CXW3_ARAVE|nr:hypothetical protein AVEN_252028-1 [Araneus ventricosus]